jgi:hypothetical protein
MPQEIKGRLNTSEQLCLADIQKKIIEEVYEPLTQEEIDKITPATQKAESELYPILHKMGIVISSPINWVIIKSKHAASIVVGTCARPAIAQAKFGLRRRTKASNPLAFMRSRSG